MLKKKHVLGSVLSVVLACPAYAELNCETQPSCKELGYRNTETSCENGKFIYCPFDTFISPTAYIPICLSCSKI